MLCRADLTRTAPSGMLARALDNARAWRDAQQASHEEPAASAPGRTAPRLVSEARCQDSKICWVFAAQPKARPTRMRFLCVAKCDLSRCFHAYAWTSIRQRIATHEKRIRVGRGNWHVRQS